MNKKIIIYQIFTRLFGNRNLSRIENGTIAENGCGKMSNIDSSQLKKIKALGITHVWFTGVIRHASQTDYSQYGIPANHPAIVKGKAGSPYAITDYYDIDPDLAVNTAKRMDEFEKLISRTHRAGLKAIIDFVPNHVARQYHSTCKPEGVRDLGEDDDTDCGFDPQNNFYYCPGYALQPNFNLKDGCNEAYIENPAKATGNDHFDASPGTGDWYETVKLNYGVDYYAGRIGHFNPTPSTWHKMLHILKYWAGKGVDGFRCDMAEMVPHEFWTWAIRQVKQEYPDILFIGEVYNPAEYRNYISAGFDYLYDKVGMYDTVRAVTCGHASATAITHAWQSVDDIRQHMLYFLENHDEQRIASDFFAGSGIKGVPALVTSALMQQNPFMLYAGQEYGERGMDKEGFSGKDGRTTIFDYWSVDTLCRAAENNLSEEEVSLTDMYKKVLNIAIKEKAIADGEFFDLMYANQHTPHFNPNSQFAFLRRIEGTLIFVAVNFSAEEIDTAITVPAHAFDYLSIKEKKVPATDLLSGEKQTFNLCKDQPVSMKLGAWGAKVWKIRG